MALCICGKEFNGVVRGKPKLYCSAHCKQVARRIRQGRKIPVSEPLGKVHDVQLSLQDSRTLLLPIDSHRWKLVPAMTAEEFLDAVELLIAPLSPMMKARVRAMAYDEVDCRRVVEDVSYDRWYVLDEILRTGVKLPEPEKARSA